MFAVCGKDAKVHINADYFKYHEEGQDIIVWPIVNVRYFSVCITVNGSKNTQSEVISKVEQVSVYECMLRCQVRVLVTHLPSPLPTLAPGCGGLCWLRLQCSYRGLSSAEESGHLAGQISDIDISDIHTYKYTSQPPWMRSWGAKIVAATCKYLRLACVIKVIIIDI